MNLLTKLIDLQNQAYTERTRKKKRQELSGSLKAYQSKKKLSYGRVSILGGRIILLDRIVQKRKTAHDEPSFLGVAVILPSQTLTAFVAELHIFTFKYVAASGAYGVFFIAIYTDVCYVHFSAV